MMRLLTTALSLTLLTGLATANGRGNHHGNGNQPAARGPRGHGPGYSNHPATHGDRRVVNRGPVRARNGRFVFAGGVTHVYARPVITTRYYNVRVRPAYVVENYTAVPGYVWVRGGWTWSGSEWRWGGGYYAADPQYSTYYNDGSFDMAVGVGIRIGG